MRFAESGYYIEKYVKCENCGVLVYGDGLKHEDSAHSEAVFCSDWCVSWYQQKQRGVESPLVDMPFEG